MCSLDLILSLNLTDIFVTTFGSPRCGNLFWARLYDNLIPAHWRVAIRSDLITALPGFGYRHVGKRVAATPNGELFLDPNSIEIVMWSFAGLNMSDHRKPVYQEALTLFAHKYLPDYQTKFVGDSSQLDDEKTSDSLVLT